MLRTARMPATRMKPAPARAQPRTRRPTTRRVIVLVATRKGAWLFHGDATRRTWRTDGPHFLGHIINHLVLDPRDGRTLLAAAKTGHLGPTIFRSTDFGRNWKEATLPPPPSPKSPLAKKDAPSTTPSGSRLPTPTSQMSGMQAPRRKDCSALMTAV